MSDGQKVVDEEEDSELKELLDSALKDLDKQIHPKKYENNVSTIVRDSSNASKENVTVEEVWTEDFIKQAADQFQRNFEELMQKGSGNKESFKKIAQTVAGAISETNDGDNFPNFQTAISQALKDLSSTTENLQNVPNISESDLANMFGQTSLEDDGLGIFPFMQGMMQSILSKDVLYGPLKDLVDKYPVWLNEKKATLPFADVVKYEKQLDLMQKVCSELEAEKPNDTEELKKKRFEKTLLLMEEMQSLGQPPEDLINLSSSVMSGILDSQKCSVM
ncbi:PREDICTED: peroxisomal biogenesis factor 19 isoform X1 [Ceratosolen solmsi marchali]|uniref:Peroxin-19 n=1 Tax=Ceratosolen solmsi marchali TaxID=326594 RepID=A0AAJ6YJK2_9HYME|nr:PREDICTED: peroxisomal biogenesis factor 19 isoform X1 [Ceratosolen solmsi marchali]